MAVLGAAPRAGRAAGRRRARRGARARGRAPRLPSCASWRALAPELAPVGADGARRACSSASSRQPATRPRAGAVAVLDPLALRARRVRALFICGLQEGVFPAPAPSAAAARRGASAASWRERPACVSGAHEDALAAERYLFYAPSRGPSELLALSWHAADDDGAPRSRSLFVDDVCDLFDERLTRAARRACAVAARRRSTSRRRRAARAAACGADAPATAPLRDRARCSRAARAAAVVGVRRSSAGSRCPVRLVRRARAAARATSSPSRAAARAARSRTPRCSDTLRGAARADRLRPRRRRRSLRRSRVELLARRARARTKREPPAVGRSRAARRARGGGCRPTSSATSSAPRAERQPARAEPRSSSAFGFTPRTASRRCRRSSSATARACAGGSTASTSAPAARRSSTTTRAARAPGAARWIERRHAAGGAVHARGRAAARRATPSAASTSRWPAATCAPRGALDAEAGIELDVRLRDRPRASSCASCATLVERELVELAPPAAGEARPRARCAARAARRASCADGRLPLSRAICRCEAR